MDMEDATEEEIQEHRRQLIRVVQQLERKTVRLIIRTLNLLVANQDLISLAVYLPGVDGADIWDLPNDNLYFEQELFSNSTTNVHACIPEALAKMTGITTLTIGYTKDNELAEEIARATGARELVIKCCPEGNERNLNEQEEQRWLNNDWRFMGKAAHKTLIAEELEDQEMTEERDKLMERRKSLIQGERGIGTAADIGRIMSSMEVKESDQPQTSNTPHFLRQEQRMATA